MSFLSEYIRHTNIYESPHSFWWWSGIAAISAVMRDSCFRRQGDSVLYPNIYILFLADSGQRKGKPVQLAEKLVKFVNNTKIISGRTSIQAILDELNYTETSAKSGAIIKGGSAIFFAEELTAGIVTDPATIGILTDIYDYKSDFKHHLRSTGKLRLEKIVFNMLAASNEELLKEVFDRRATNGGLLARTFLVTPNEYRKANSLFRVQDTSESFKKVQNELYRVSCLHGEFSFSEEAIREYENWYLPFKNNLEKKKDKQGIMGRIHTSIVKLSMILAANDLSLEITQYHMEEAIMESLALMPNYNSFLMTGGKSSISEAGSILLTELHAALDHTLSRKKVISDHWMDIDTEVLDNLSLALQQAGIINELHRPDGILFMLTDKGVAYMNGSMDTGKLSTKELDTKKEATK